MGVVDFLQQEDLVPDKFVIYGDPYRDIREAMAQAVLSRTRKELTKVLQVCSVR